MINCRHTFIAATAAMMLFPLTVSAEEPNLPTVEILGREYYYYEVKKGDSLYGIAKQFDWDPQELLRLNPSTGHSLEKGARMYYPTGKVVVLTAVTDDGENEDVEVPFEPITHVVAKGETAYGIARQYNISLDTLYANHPSAKYGVKAGETIVIKQRANALDEDGGFYYHTIKPGDTLYNLSKTYNTTVEKILAANPGVSERNFRIGDTVRIAVNSRGKKRMRTELVDERRVESLDTYKVGKNETWSTIAANTGATVEDLRDANNGVTKPQKNQIITVPNMQIVQVEREVEDVDSRELTSDGIREIYDSVHGVEEKAIEARQVRVALILDDSSSKRDSEFVKGLLLALNDYKDMPYQVSVKIERGNDSAKALASLSEYQPTFVLSTADKNFPGWLSDYGRDTTTEIINVFDVKNESYVDNPRMVQILTPTSFFNEEIAQAVAERYGNRTLLMVGTPDPQDTMAEAIQSAMGGMPLTLSTEDLASYPLGDAGSYLIYAYPTASSEVEKFLEALAASKEMSPVAEVSVIGRPSWITLTETLGDRMHAADVHIPSRFYFDWDSTDGKAFADEFTEAYGHAPVKSYPLYSAMGYDMAHYFIPGAATTEGDFNRSIPDSDPIQSGVRLKRTSNWSGFYNPVCYLVRLTPYGSTDKIVVR